MLWVPTASFCRYLQQRLGIRYYKEGKQFYFISYLIGQCKYMYVFTIFNKIYCSVFIYIIYWLLLTTFEPWSVTPPKRNDICIKIWKSEEIIEGKLNMQIICHFCEAIPNYVMMAEVEKQVKIRENQVIHMINLYSLP